VCPQNNRADCGAGFQPAAAFQAAFRRNAHDLLVSGHNTRLEPRRARLEDSMSIFRADRLATLHFFHPLRRLRAQGAGIPILMYHSISECGDSARHPYYRTSTTVKMFEQQVRFLHENGYRTVGVTEASMRMQTLKPTEKRVAITFDDGYLDFYTNAFPILNHYGYSATVFLPTDFIGQTAHQFKGVECLTWSQVRELRKAGVGFGSHTVTHPQLHTVSTEQLRTEVGRSKDEIEKQLGESVDTFAYPYAFPETDRAFVETLREALQENEYRSGVTTIIGRTKPSDNPFFMRRLPVNSHDDPRLFQAKLEGGYDWLRTAQYVSKLRTT
jgi:peptidoglycan/xylan/chitin deacetylase (PgdA/CDA1 family)